MGFLRRIIGRGRGNDGDDAASADVGDGDGEDGEHASVELNAEERDHEMSVLRAEAERLDELAQRQLKYADHAWQPPAQGGERRADDGDSRPDA
jgi:hypothetical protein